MNPTMKTYSMKAGEVDHKWILVDASTAPVGRVATFIANRLTGKYQPTYTPSMDNGDYVVVINAEKAVLTGAKEEDKKYYTYSGYTSGLKTTAARDMREKKPERIIELAVKGMLPKNKLQAERMKRLRVFAGDVHDHVPQQPVKMEIK